MDAINIPEAQVVPLEHMAQGIEGLRIVFVNVFGISHADGSWTLVDCGLPLSAPLIRKWAERHFGTAPNAIVLTHGHFDHVSAAGELAEHWDRPIYAHPLEQPYLNGTKEYAAPNFSAGGGMMSLLSPLLPRGPVNLGSRLRELAVFAEGESTLAEMPGWQIKHTPGHTPGHVSLFRPDDRTLLAGDAFCTTKPESFFAAAIKQEPELHGPPAYFTSDWNQARRSVQLLAGLGPQTLAPGHGQPVSGSRAAASLRELAARFEEIAVPDNRKPAA
ncbi:MAG TPA: MBL fold metallo-hydrolase [Candidatus Sulfotelmatobacter sp.]|jgi:glyoxylase-like metal-dependent hydrolase (beta-lactamase superfamily II)|nr:MBL fold metallo-hydrolase [Candidatus Sulfotelmatobacter sp.]